MPFIEQFIFLMERFFNLNNELCLRKNILMQFDDLGSAFLIICIRVS